MEYDPFVSVYRDRISFTFTATSDRQISLQRKCTGDSLYPRDAVGQDVASRITTLRGTVTSASYGSLRPVTFEATPIRGL